MDETTFNFCYYTLLIAHGIVSHLLCRDIMKWLAEREARKKRKG